MNVTYQTNNPIENIPVSGETIEECQAKAEAVLTENQTLTGYYSVGKNGKLMQTKIEND